MMNQMNPIKSFNNWLFDQSKQKPATIEALVTEETVKTIQVHYKSQTAWLQKSLVNLYQHEENRVTITIPLWLFTRKFPGLTNRSKMVNDIFHRIFLIVKRRKNERIHSA